MELAPSVHRLTQVLDQILDALDHGERASLVRASLSRTQARVLAAVASSRETRLTEISRTLGMPKSTACVALEGLERLGLLSRARQANDRRVYAVRLSERGRSLARRILIDRRDAIAQAAADLTPYQRKTMASALEALLKALPEGTEKLEE